MSYMCLCTCAHDYLLSCMQLFAILQTVAHQTPLSMELFRQESGVGCHFLLQGMLLTQVLNLHLLYLLHCRQSHWGSLYTYTKGFVCALQESVSQSCISSGGCMMGLQNCTHLTRQQSNAQNSPSQAAKVREP